ncbi:MAG: Holliday junction branch migration protein RuvA [Cytophagaceae bacterium]|nr:Holliday junction branch migration protein RuvA [Cytophagaceae bacterium]MDW8456599.1 Holliday junction branch migration protein RuvA [Cytophagaceae bacterium]
MIVSIQGELSYLEPTYAIIENQGIGYQVKISLNTYAHLKNSGRMCKLHTHLHIKEDAHTLYGFSSEQEKRVFLYLISVNGVGPSIAMMMLSSLTPGEVETAIAKEDLRTIQGIKGIGAKTAQRIILELKDKIKKEVSGDILNQNTSSHNRLRQEALSALVTLGISKSVAEKNIDQIIKTQGEALSLEQLIKQALKMN